MAPVLREVALVVSLRTSSVWMNHINMFSCLYDSSFQIRNVSLMPIHQLKGMTTVWLKKMYWFIHYMTPTELTFINWHSIICALQWLTDKSMALKINELVSTQRGIHTLYCGAFFLGVIYLTYSSSFPLEHRAFWGWQLPTVFCISFISLRATIKDTVVVKKVMFHPKHCKSDLSLWFTPASRMRSIPDRRGIPSTV